MTGNRGVDVSDLFRICIRLAIAPCLIALIPATAPAFQSVDATDDPQNASATTVSEDTIATRTFELIVVDGDENPVAEAAVEVRTTPNLTAGQIKRGTFARKNRYRTQTATDAEGLLAFDFPRGSKRLTLVIKQDGYSPYYAQWSPPSDPDGPPDRFVAKLESGWSVGGIVVDSQGQPISDVDVTPGGYYQQRPGVKRKLGLGITVKTDGQGRWRFNMVPNSDRDVFVSFDSPDFSPLRTSLPRDGYGLAANETPSKTISMDRGLTVTGTVNDAEGNPVDGALVFTKFLNDVRETRTDSAGRYRLAGCEPRTTRLVVYATGFATDMKEIRVDPDLGPIDFSLLPGGHVRIRVVDEDGKGIARSRIFFQRWRGRFQYFEFKHVDQYTDENGVWEWNEAPLDHFAADICRADGMQLSDQTLIARQEEYVFSPPRKLAVSGTVTDAKTKRPIDHFTVTPGLRNQHTANQIDWIESERYESRNGIYRVAFRETVPANVIRIEADGYRSMISRDVRPDEGTITIDLELQPAPNLSGLILSADGRPAAGARIAIGEATSQIILKNGRIDDDSTYATTITADEEGRYSFPDRGVPFDLVVTHDFGVAHLRSTDGPIPEPIKLVPWATVQGVFHIAGRPTPNIPLVLDTDGLHAYGDNVPNTFTHHTATSGEGGRFRFDRIVPGRGTIGRQLTLMVDDGATEVTSSVRTPLDLAPGESARLELGREGRAVIGQLRVPDDYTEQVFWNFALVSVGPVLPYPEKPEAMKQLTGDQNAIGVWLQTEQGKRWSAEVDAVRATRNLYPHFRATVDRDGSFRIDDVPAGHWELSVRFTKNSPGSANGIEFQVADDEETRLPINLGTIPLRK